MILFVPFFFYNFNPFCFFYDLYLLIVEISPHLVLYPAFFT